MNSLLPELKNLILEQCGYKDLMNMMEVSSEYLKIVNDNKQLKNKITEAHMELIRILAFNFLLTNGW